VGGLAGALVAYRMAGAGVWTGPTPALFIPILCLFAGYMIQGATEELMFRGWILQLVASRHGLVLGVVISTVVFAAMHAGNEAPSASLAAGGPIRGGRWAFRCRRAGSGPAPRGLAARGLVLRRCGVGHAQPGSTSGRRRNTCIERRHMRRVCILAMSQLSSKARQCETPPCAAVK